MWRRWQPSSLKLPGDTSLPAEGQALASNPKCTSRGLTLPQAVHKCRGGVERPDSRQQLSSWNCTLSMQEILRAAVAGETTMRSWLL